MSLLAVLLRVFRSPSLGVGANKIEPVESGEALGAGVDLFVGQAALLNRVHRELFVLRRELGVTGGGHREAALVDACVQRAGELGLTDVWLVSDGAVERRTDQIGDVRVTSVASADVLANLLNHPPDAGDDFCRAAGTDVEFLNATYRRRYATLLEFDSGSRALRRSARSANLDERLALWAEASGSPKPMLVLGDRGSGKTWQLLRFCVDQYHRHVKKPTEAPLALYISLRHWAAQWADHRAVDLFTLVISQCPWLVVKWDASMLRALVSQGRIILCFDGFDEIHRQPTLLEIQEHLTELFRLLPPGARFVVSSRTTLFDSLASLAKLSTWSASTVGSSTDVCELQPFSQEDVRSYLKSLDGKAQEAGAVRAAGLLSSQDVIGEAVAACVTQPGLLAHLRLASERPDRMSGLAAIKEIMEGALISFNLDSERTSAIRRDARGQVHHFDNEQRAEMLGELAWFLAERRLSEVDLNAPPVRLSFMYGVDSDALKRDIRSQTVFELASSDESGGVVFGVPYPATSLQSSGSVAKDYFLARHVVSRVTECLSFGRAAIPEAMRFFGAIELTPLAAALVREMLSRGPDRLEPHKLGKAFLKRLSQLARKGNFEVFEAPYRYVVSNLEGIGVLSKEEASACDPWIGLADGFGGRIRGLPSYQMVLVPPCSSSTVRRWGASRKEGCGSRTGDSSGPFLIGQHEVTNEEFLEFIEDQTGQGPAWAVDRVTRAGSRGAPKSKVASRTNEYHLYFWDRDETGRFRPHRDKLRHPVVYVSWFAALAFCDWLSSREQRDEAGQLTPKRGRSVQRCGESTSPHFRLPTAVEWRWAAQGSYKRAEYPWDLAPYPVPADVTTPRAVERYRAAVRAVALDQHQRSSSVAYEDEFSVMGVSGLIGNVKEWVQDTVPQSARASRAMADVAIVLGSTAHLDESSFRFDYFATLFPENTNPDVGFRVARSLSDDELGTLKARQQALAEAITPVADSRKKRG